MTDIKDVKKKIREVLIADASISGIVGSRVYEGWLDRSYALPCITITDVSENGVEAQLGGNMDEYNSTVQVDVWCKGTSAKSGPLNRDELAKTVKVALGEKANFQAMRAAGFTLYPPTILPLTETDLKPPVYRKSLRFPVFYFTESYA